jgi:hypothetical protein
MNPPEGICLAEPGRGKSPLSVCFSIRYGGMVPVNGEDARSFRFAQDFGSGLTPANRLNFESRPRFYRRRLLKMRGLKSARRCLTYSRIWCLSRDKHHTLWPKSVRGYRIGKLHRIPFRVGSCRRELGQALSPPGVKRWLERYFLEWRRMLAGRDRLALHYFALGERRCLQREPGW